MPFINPNGGIGGGLSNQTFSDIGAGVGDIFAGFGDQMKAQGAELQGQAYGEAATLAGQNAQFSEMSTAIQTAQAEKRLNVAQGRTTANVAGAGFATNGTALDILRENANEGATTAAVTNYQGKINTAGYQEQQQSYQLMQEASNVAANAEKTASVGSFISGGISVLAGIATLAP